MFLLPFFWPRCNAPIVSQTSRGSQPSISRPFSSPCLASRLWSFLQSTGCIPDVLVHIYIYIYILWYTSIYIKYIYIIYLVRIYCVTSSAGPSLVPVYKRQLTIPAICTGASGTNYSAHCVPRWCIPSVPSDSEGIHSGQPTLSIGAPPIRLAAKSIRGGHTAVVRVHDGRKYKNRLYMRIETRRCLHLRPDSYLCLHNTRQLGSEYSCEFPPQ